MAVAVENDLALPRDPTSALHAATKQYVDQVAQGLSPKDSVRAATTANITIATALNSGDALDGVTLATGDRVLVKDQSTASQNGIYVVAASPGRSTDMDAWSEVPGASVFVEEGTTNHDTLWVSTADTGGTIDSTSMTWSQFGSIADLIAGGGIGKSGNTLSVAAGTGILQDADGVSIDTAVVPRKAVSNTFTAEQVIDVGSITTGIALLIDRDDTGTSLSFTRAATNKGSVQVGTGAPAFLVQGATDIEVKSNAGDLRLNAVGGDIAVIGSKKITGLGDPAAATDAVNRQSAAKTVSGTITGDGSTNPLTFTHNLNTKDVNVDVRNLSTDEFIIAKVVASTVNAVTIEFATALGNTVTRRVIVTGIQG